MDDTAPYPRMLTSLRQTFNQRLPAGLTSTADSRLQRTLGHYISEVQRVKGGMDEQEILRESYDSMTNWFRRNTTQLSPVFRQGAEIPRPPPADMIEHAVAPELGEGLSSIGSTPWQDTKNDPLDLFERLKSQRVAPAPSPVTIPELLPLELRAKSSGGVQAKDILQKQEDVVKYRDTEYNLILNSRDRDWLNSPATQNRYNFSVQFDSTRPQRSGAMPTLMQRLRNIVRVEFVKAIVPVEALRTVVIPSECDDPAATQNFFSVLALPNITVQLDEHQGNNVGTNNGVDRSLAVCQYDSTWRSDGSHSTQHINRGYALFIPKFMKAQRVYAPTPLSNFQRLSFQLTDPENLQLSTCPDVARIQRIVWGNDVLNITSPPLPCFTVGSNEYLYIQTRDWFPVDAFSRLDRIVFDGLTFTSTTPTLDVAGKKFIEWLQRSEGHIVISPAYFISGTTLGGITNACKFSNVIVIRNRHVDPTANGSCELETFTGGADDDTLATEFKDYPEYNQGGAVLNLSRQVQLTMRVITRDYDGASNLRPDNV